jgi:DtxR family transcriptional regulator, Mn-dependent transcriptional regulator
VGLSPHMEMYLKAMLVLDVDGAPVRAKDLAAKLGLSRPSVTKAVASLARSGYLTHEPYHLVALTPKGRQLGREVMRRHQILRAFLTGVLGVPAEIADEDSCALEHVVSRSTLTALTDFLAFLGQCPQAPLEVVRHFQEVASCKDSPCCTRCGLDRLVAPALPQPATPLSKQHTRF